MHQQIQGLGTADLLRRERLRAVRRAGARAVLRHARLGRQVARLRHQPLVRTQLLGRQRLGPARPRAHRCGRRGRAGLQQQLGQRVGRRGLDLCRESAERLEVFRLEHLGLGRRSRGFEDEG